MKKFKKVLAVILAMVMLLTALPVTQAFAEEVYDALTLNTLKTVSVNGEDVILSFTPDADGFYKFFSTGSCDTVATLYDSEWNELCEGDESKDSNFQIVQKLSAGCIYYLSVNEFYNEKASFKVKVTESVGIVSATVIKYPDDMTCVEGLEYRASLKGLEVLFVTTEGEEVSWTFGTFLSIGDLRISCNKSYISDDGYYHVIIECAGCETELLYEILENPIESIEYKSNHDIVLYENTGGYYDFNDEFYYYYDLPKDASFVINYKDGTSVQCKADDIIDDNSINIYTNQFEEPWSVGTNYIYANYMGVETQIPVYIKTCPFKKIAINSTPDREYIMGDFKYGYFDERNRYIFEPTDITGLSFTVEYEDGRIEIFNDTDFDVENQTIAGLPYSFEESWVVRPKTTTATLRFMGAEIKYDVNVVESPLSNFEMTWFPDKTDYEDRYFPVFDGMEFTLTFKDGTTETVVLSDENTNYGDGNWVDYEITVGDYTIEVFEGWNEYDETIYGFACLGQWVEYEGVWFDKSREVESIDVENFSPTADKMVLDVKYTDGSHDVLNTRTVSIDKRGDKGYFGFVKTENGVCNFETIKIIENGEITGYKLAVLGEEITVNGQFATIGDVDDDGNITIMDATLVQQHVAQQITLSDAMTDAADTDKNGELTVMDVTLIQRFVAKDIDKF